MAAAAPAGYHPRRPTDRYVDQMARGFRGLRFEPELENDYRRQLIAECARPSLIVTIAAVLLWSGFAALDFLRLGLTDDWTHPIQAWTIFILRWLAMAALLSFLTPWIRNHPAADIIAMATFSILGIAAAVTTVIYQSLDLPSGYANLVVITMAAFLPLGMRFYMALSSSVLIVVVTAVSGLLMHSAELLADHAYLVSVMLVAVVVASVGGYLHERAHRQQFLLSAILSRQAQIDPLTNLGNRRLFEQQTALALSQARRTGDTVIFAIADIDHFKRFNDRYGHAAGDTALRSVAIELEQTARRPMDMVARLGGEEFCILLYDSGFDTARAILDDLRLRIATRSFPGTDGVTISIGATVFSPDDDLPSLYERADKLLYDSKEQGRNRVTMG